MTEYKNISAEKTGKTTTKTEKQIEDVEKAIEIFHEKMEWLDREIKEKKASEIKPLADLYLHSGKVDTAFESSIEGFLNQLESLEGKRKVFKMIPEYFREKAERLKHEHKEQALKSVDKKIAEKEKALAETRGKTEEFTEELRKLKAERQRMSRF